MKMQTILNDLLAKLGCPPTDDTQLTLRLDDRRDVTIALDNERDEVVLSIVMDKLNRELLRGALPLSARLLSMTLFGAETAGAALSWSEECGCLVLWCRLANAFDGPEELERRLEEIMYVADEMDALAADAAPGDDAAEPQPRSAEEAPAVSGRPGMGWLMV